MKINKEILTLLAILVIAAFIRLWKLGSIPPHLTPDEASLGYNAYSILKTGRDEYGELLPIVFKSFGDYKPGLYIYLTAPFVAIFGLTEFATRFPSALAGVFAVWLIYLIVNEFKNLQFTTSYRQLGLVAAFLLAINPWHIHFSRGAWEANVALTLTLSGVYFFLKSFKDSKFLVPASLFFSLTLLTYQGAKLSTLIVVGVLVLTFWKEVVSWFSKDRKNLFFSFICSIVIVLPIILSLLQGRTGRLEVFSVFSYPRPKDYLQTFLDQGEEKVGTLTYYLYHPESLNFARGVLGRWFNHASARFLFFEGDWQNPRHSAPNHGVLLLFDLVFIVFGMISFLSKRTKFSFFVLMWLVFAPLPGVLSRDQVHAVRSINMLVPLVLVSSQGLAFLLAKISSLSSAKVRNVYLGFIVIGLAGSLIYFFDAYFIHLPKHASQLWSYGYKQIVETVTPLQDQYREIRIQQSFAQPYVYFLFYQKYDPTKYQKQARLTESEYKGDVGYVERLDNICFCPIDWSVNRGDHGTLVIGDPIRIPIQDAQDKNQFNKIAEIKYLNGETAFWAIEVK